VVNRTLVALDVDGVRLEKYLLLVRSSHLPKTASASGFADCLLQVPNTDKTALVPLSSSLPA
jgi:hypothetical protein